MRAAKERRAEILTIIGAHLIMAPISFLWVYGNLSSYMNSFFRYECYPDCFDGDSQWILNLYLAFFGAGLFLFDKFRRSIGLQWTNILSVSIYNIAFLASAWTVQKSVIATCVLLGVLNGVAAGAGMNIGFAYVNAWSPKHVAVYLNTVTAVAPFMSVVQNQILTAFVNPRNLKPDAHQGHEVFFSQSEILNSVPTAIILLGCINLGLQLIACLLMSTPKASDPILSKQGQSKIENSGEINSSQSVNDKSAHLKLDRKSNGFVRKEGEERSKCNSKEVMNHYGSNATKNEQDSLSTSDNTSPLSLCPDNLDTSKSSNNEFHAENNDNCKLNPSDKKMHTHQYKTLEAMKTARFWAFWLYGASVTIGSTLKNSYYKEFGLLYIPNDRHMTLLGSLIPVVICASRVAFGLLMKRNLVKINDCLVVSFSLNCLTCAFWYFAPGVSESLYMLLILVMAFSHSFLHVVLATGTFKEFGAEHFATIFAMSYSGAPIISIISAFYMTSLLNAVGWFWVFIISSFLSFISLAFTMATMY